MSNEALAYSRLANALLVRLSEIEAETLTGEKNVAEKTAAILKAFEDVSEIVEERLKEQTKDAKV